MKPREKINELALLCPKTLLPLEDCRIQIEAIKDYFNEIIPELEKKIEIVGVNARELAQDLFNHSTMRIEQLEKKIESLDPKNPIYHHDYTPSYIAGTSNPKTGETTESVFHCGGEKDYTCPNCGEKFRGWHKCKKFDIVYMSKKPECDIVLSDPSKLPSGTRFSIKNNTDAIITVSAPIKKPECEHEWIIDVQMLTNPHNYIGRHCDKDYCGKKQKLTANGEWEDVK